MCKLDLLSPLHSLSEAPCVRLGKVARPPAQMRCLKIEFMAEKSSLAVFVRWMRGWIVELTAGMCACETGQVLLLEFIFSLRITHLQIVAKVYLCKLAACVDFWFNGKSMMC